MVRLLLKGGKRRRSDIPRLRGFYEPALRGLRSGLTVHRPIAGPIFLEGSWPDRIVIPKRFELTKSLSCSYDGALQRLPLSKLVKKVNGQYKRRGNERY
jgi:hypothetical protein